MKGGTLQINWHDTRPVLAVDFHPISCQLATGGADHDVKLWSIISGDDQKSSPTVSYLTSLSYHGFAVNALRFSPTGEELASGADGGELIIWKLHLSEAGESWKVFKNLSFHRKDVLDLQWSPDSAYLISGSVDNCCIIWDISKGSVLQILDAHIHYVQGVAWDPLGKYVVSLSSDRTCRVYANKAVMKAKGSDKMNFTCQHVIIKVEQLSSVESKSVRNHLFHDETLPSFFRRLAWSPDGLFLLVPAGCYKSSLASETVNAAYVFSRKDLSRPALLLPSVSKPIIAVCFCPVPFAIRGLSSDGYFKLPYRLIFAVATLNSLCVYDTEITDPLVVMAGIHYAPITSIAWSPNGKHLAASSQDGFCTLIEFEAGELGLPFSQPEEKRETNRVTRNPDAEKPECLLNGECPTDDGSSSPVDSRKLEAENNGDKHASSPSPAATPFPNRTARKRIMPVAIDPL